MPRPGRSPARSARTTRRELTRATELRRRHALLPEAAAFTSALAIASRPDGRRLGSCSPSPWPPAGTGPDGRLHLTVLDIGQGDAILIEAPDGTTALIDGGVDPDLTLRRDRASAAVPPRRIDVVVSPTPTRTTSAAWGGAATLRSRGLRGRRSGRGDRSPSAARRGGRTRTRRSAGGGRGRPRDPRWGCRLEILFPTPADATGPLPEGDINNASIVVHLRYGTFDALLTGDAEAPIEGLLVQRDQLQPVEVLKVGHHGSDSSSTPAFLAAIRPAVAIISAGRDNEYGHPHRSTLDNLAAVPGLRVFRTDRDGSVEVVTNGSTYWITSDHGASTPIPTVGPAVDRARRYDQRRGRTGAQTRRRGRAAP